jgi:hypothetical protein
MSWSIQYIDEHALVEAIYSGSVTAKDLKDAFRETHGVLSERNCVRMIANCSGMTKAPSLVDIFELVFLILRSGGLPSEFREALILPEQERVRRGAQFFETVCRNRGLNVRIFAHRDEGVHWLNGAV